MPNLEIPEPPANTRAFYDPEKLRALVLKNAKIAFASKLNSLESGQYKLQVTDVDYEDPNKIFSLAEQKKALLEKHDLVVPLKGTFELIDKTTGKVLDKKRTIIANIPYITERNTSLLNGSEYIFVNQQRLKSGVYTRIRNSGEVEAHVNVIPGTGLGGHVIFYPERSLLVYKVQNTEIKLYGLLRDLGVSDSTMEQSWGKEIYLKNKQTYTGQEIDKFYNKVFALEIAQSKA